MFDFDQIGKKWILAKKGRVCTTVMDIFFLSLKKNGFVFIGLIDKGAADGKTVYRIKRHRFGNGWRHISKQNRKKKPVI